MNYEKLLKVKLQAVMQNEEIQEIAIRASRMEKSQQHSLLGLIRSFMDK